MTPEALVASLGWFAGSFAVGALSAVIPLASIEVFLVGLVLVRGVDPVSGALIVACAAAGQLAGKLPIYSAARGVGALQKERVSRLRARLGRFANAPHLVLATSAVLGLPPFSIMATAAGVLAIRVRAFCAIVLAGRAVRFAILIAIAAAAR
jgi:membrane protein YqaA with SNARE-associated domain